MIDYELTKLLDDFEQAEEDDFDKALREFDEDEIFDEEEYPETYEDTFREARSDYLKNVL